MALAVIFVILSNVPKLLDPLFIFIARSEKASLSRPATSVVELWPGLGDFYKPLLVGRSFGVLFPFEEWLGFVIVFVTTAFLRVSRRCFFSFASV